MAARGNAAKKTMEAKAAAGGTKRKSNDSDEITAEDLAKFRKEEEEREKNKVKDKWRDPDCAGNALSKKWMETSAVIKSVAYGDNFGGFILVCIIIAGVLVGIQTYEGMEDNNIVKMTDLVILGAFTVECIMKIFSEGLVSVVCPPPLAPIRSRYLTNPLFLTLGLLYWSFSLVRLFGVSG